MTQALAAGDSPDVVGGDDGPWLTLREAAETAQVSVSALRKWYRSDKVRARDEDGPYGPQKLVNLPDVLRQAGRTIPALRAVEPIRQAEPTPAPGGEMVPMLRDHLDVLMEQIGNLHQAGQQMAELAERAAKAETTAEFLKTQNAELRAQLARARGEKATEEPAAEEPKGRRWWGGAR